MGLFQNLLHSTQNGALFYGGDRKKLDSIFSNASFIVRLWSSTDIKIISGLTLFYLHRRFRPYISHTQFRRKVTKTLTFSLYVQLIWSHLTHQIWDTNACFSNGTQCTISLRNSFFVIIHTWPFLSTPTHPNKWRLWAFPPTLLTIRDKTRYLASFRFSW